MKVLIVLKYYLGDALKVTSDGQFDDEWAAVRAEMATRYGMATVADERLLVRTPPSDLAPLPASALQAGAGRLRHQIDK